MKNRKANAKTAAEDEMSQQLRMSLDPGGTPDARREGKPRAAPEASARTQEHMRRLPAGGLRGTDSRSTVKTEYVMRMLVSGRALPEEPPVPAAPAPPEPKRGAAPPPGVITLENLTFDDLLAELENL